MEKGFFKLKRVAETIEELNNRHAADEEIKEYLDFLKENFGVGLSNIAAILEMPASNARLFLRRFYSCKEIAERFEDVGPSKEQRGKLTEWLDYSKKRKEDYALMRICGREDEIRSLDDIEDIFPVMWAELKKLSSKEKGFYLEFLITHYPANYPVYVENIGVPNIQAFKNMVAHLRKDGLISNESKRTKETINPKAFFDWLEKYKPRTEKDLAAETMEVTDATETAKTIKVATETAETMEVIEPAKEMTTMKTMEVTDNEHRHANLPLSIMITLNLCDVRDRDFLDEIMSNDDIAGRVKIVKD